MILIIFQLARTLNVKDDDSLKPRKFKINSYRSPFDLPIFASQTLTKLKMIIKVKTLTGKEIAVELKSDAPIYRIKQLLEEKEGIPPSQQRLIFQGKQMYVLNRL